jgi:hypothetical protein
MADVQSDATDQMPAGPTSSALPAKPRLWLAAGLAVAISLHLASAAFHVLFGGLNVDEGFYGLAARNVTQGALPYRDFGYSQPPVLPFVNGAVMRLIGFGLVQQRSTNGLWGALALGLCAWLAARRTRPWVGLVLALAFSLWPPWMYFIHLGKAYALTSLAAAAAAWVFLQWPRAGRKHLVLSALAALGIGCRLASAPYFLVLWLAALADGGLPSAREALRAVAELVGLLAVVFLPLWLLAPESMSFWVFQFHASSLQHRDWYLGFTEIFLQAPACCIGLLGLASLTLATLRPWPRREAILAAAAVLALASNLLPSGAVAAYSVPFLLPLALAVVLLIADVARAWSFPRRAALVAVLLLLQLGTNPIANSSRWADSRGNAPSLCLPRAAPDYDLGLPERSARIRALVQQLLPPGQPLIGPNLIPALETNRPVPRNLSMGPFSVTRDLPAASAQRLHLATDREIAGYLEDPRVTLLSFADRLELNYGWSMPSFALPPEGLPPRWAPSVLREFVTVYKGGHDVLLARSEYLRSKGLAPEHGAPGK